MGNKDKTTASARVPSSNFEFVKRTLDTNDVDNGITRLIRATFRKFEEDKDYREFLLKSMEAEDTPLRDYFVELTDSYGIQETDKKVAINGIKELIAGVQNRNYDQAIRGGEKLNAIDTDIAQDTAKYISGIHETYWVDR